MSRWAAAFHAAVATLTDDTADTADTTTPAGEVEGGSVACVSSVTCQRELESVPQSIPQAEMLAGLMLAAMRRPPSWPDATAMPLLGCSCSCCRSGRWWTEATEPRGWWCWTCHPPSEGAGVLEVLT